MRRYIILLFIMSIRKRQGKPIDYRIIIVGDEGVGKTTLFKRYIQDDSKTMERISTVDFKKRLVNLHDKEVALSIWDTVGQEKFRSIVATYLKSCHGILLVFDLGNELSWRNVQSTWSNLITSHAQGVPSLLIGNKNDVPSSINRQEIHSWCKQKGIYYIETCAKTGFQVSQTLNTLATFVDINNDPLWASQPKMEVEGSLDAGDTTKSTKESYRETRDSIKAWHNGTRTNSLRLSRSEWNKQRQGCCK